MTGNANRLKSIAHAPNEENIRDHGNRKAKNGHIFQTYAYHIFTCILLSQQ